MQEDSGGAGGRCLKRDFVCTRAGHRGVRRFLGVDTAARYRRLVVIVGTHAMNSARTRAAGACFFWCAAFAGNAAAQSDNAILTARDAFGERVGVEVAGIYSESQVRGFSLANTGAHRIEGAYFVRDFAPPDAVLAGVSVMSGVNGARLAYPSPSGAVDYRLKSPRKGDRTLSITASVRELGQTVIESGFSLANEAGDLGVAGGAFWTTPVEYPNEVEYRVYNAGIVPQWKPTETIRARAVIAAEYSDYRGELGYLSAVNDLPPKLDYHNFAPPWALIERTTLTGGLLLDARFSGGWSFSGSTFYADNQREPSDFSLWTVRPDRTADLTFNRTVNQRTRSLSSEGVAAYQWTVGGITSTATAAVRNRRSRTNAETIAPIRIGLFNLINNDFAYPPEPFFPEPIGATRSEVDQLVGSLGYTGLFGDSVEVRSAVHRSRYDKRVTPPLGTTSRRLETRWLYNASIVVAITDRATIFADTVKGVEETGTAPQNAVNREEVLPPVVAETYEAGVRYAFTPKLSLTGTVFTVEKIVPGLRTDGVFTLIGDVRHRGIEFSLAGEIAEGTTVVVGGLAMRPTLKRPGLPTIKPVGVAPNVLVASVNHQLTWRPIGPGWSVDGRVTFQSGRVANQTASFKTKDIASLSLGTRYEFMAGDFPAQLRISALNVGTSRPWTVGQSGILLQTDPFRVRASLRLTVL